MDEVRDRPGDSLGSALVTPPLAAVAAGSAVLGLAGGWLVPRVIARLPEPAPEAEPAAAPDPHQPTTQTEPDTAAEPDTATEPDTAAEQDTAARPDPDLAAGEPAASEAGDPAASAPPDEKVPYAQLAASPGLAWRSALAAAVACGVAGWSLGWSPALPTWLFLGVVGVALGYIDWRTRLLPTRIIAPSYAVVVALTVLASALAADWGALLGALYGWLVFGGVYVVLWFVYPRGMGYGDVRLSGVLGIALGWLGWAELLTGLYAGFLLGAVIGGGLSLLKIVDRKRYPFGPFMLLGALAGVVVGPTIAGWYGS